MYGLIVRLVALSGQRDQLIAILLESGAGMPGCLSYVVARDATNADAIWITEVWDSEASHDASFTLPLVQKTMERGKALIASVDPPTVTGPAGGIGLATPKG